MLLFGMDGEAGGLLLHQNSHRGKALSAEARLMEVDPEPDNTKSLKYIFILILNFKNVSSG